MLRWKHAGAPPTSGQAGLEVASQVEHQVAADGAKEAMWDVVNCGYKVCNFVHDELLVYLPYDETMTLKAQHVSDLMRLGMRKVIENTAIKVEWEIRPFWSKSKENILAKGKSEGEICQ